MDGIRAVDRRKMDTKHSLLADRHEAPLAIHTAGANVSNYSQASERFMYDMTA